MTFDEWWDRETAKVGQKGHGRGAVFYNLAKLAWEQLEAENDKLREELAAAKKKAWNAAMARATEICRDGYKQGIGDRFQGDVFAATIEKEQQS